MDAANGAATATISNGGTPVAPTDRTAVDTLVGRNITDHTAPDATALRECHFGEQTVPPPTMRASRREECAGRTWRDYSGRGEKEGRDGRSENAGKPTTSTPEPHRWFLTIAGRWQTHHSHRPAPLVSVSKARRSTGCTQRA